MRTNAVHIVLSVAVLITSHSALGRGRGDAGGVKSSADVKAEQGVKSGDSTNAFRNSDAARIKSEQRAKGAAGSVLAPKSSSNEHAIGGGSRDGSKKSGGVVILPPGAKKQESSATTKTDARPTEVKDGNAEAIANLIKVDESKKGTAAIDPAVVKKAEAVDALTQKLGENLRTLKSSYNTTTLKEFNEALNKEVMSVLDSAAVKKNLTPEEIDQLKTAALMYLVEMSKFEGKDLSKEALATLKADAVKQLGELFKDFSDELAKPEMKEMAIKYILGTLAYYGKNGETGETQLKAAIESWNKFPDPAAREGVSEWMGAMAAIHTDHIAKQMAVKGGPGPRDVKFDDAWRATQGDIRHWLAKRFLENGVSPKDVPEMVRSIACGDCNGNSKKTCKL